METKVKDLKKLKVALVHDWLIHMRGGEKVLEALAELFPDATIYTLFFDRTKLSPSLQRMKIKASFLQAVPGIRKFYRWLLPIFPRVMRSIQIKNADLVVSSSHCVAKGIPIPKGALHVCYCHTPMRYLWGYEAEYFGGMAAPLRLLSRAFMQTLKKQDLKSNEGVHHFIANSENVRRRIQKFYQRDSTVIYPPLDTLCYRSPEQTTHERDYYLVVSAFVPYKRVDLVIETFNTLDRQLLIVGQGPLGARYKSLRKSEKISFLGSVSNQELQKLYAGARALIFPTEEDFGIVPLEAQACGTPVIALEKGGALESVKAGIFFKEQTPEALRAALLEFEQKSFDHDRIPAMISSFSKDCFKEHLARFLEEACSHALQ